MEREVELRSFFDAALGPDFASVTTDDTADRGKANPGAGKFAGAVQPLKRLEQAIG